MLLTINVPLARQVVPAHRGFQFLIAKSGNGADWDEETCVVQMEQDEWEAAVNVGILEHTSGHFCAAFLVQLLAEY